MRRISLVALPLLLALLAWPQWHGVNASPAAVPGSYYVATGDSLSVGYTTAGVPIDPQCASPDAIGYVCQFYRYLKTINPSIQLQNFGVPGANSCVWLHGFGNGSPCTDPLLSAPAPSQVDETVQFANAHPGMVSPISVDIGGDDLLPLLPQAALNPAGVLKQLPTVLAATQANIDAGLSQIRAAAPNAEIIVINQYDPLGGLGSPPLPQGLPDAARQAIDQLAAVVKAEAVKYNAVYVDVEAAFDAHPGGAALLTFVPETASNPSQINIHPTPDGYDVYSQAVIAASGYAPAAPSTPAVTATSAPTPTATQPPLTVTAHLARKSLVRGKTDKVTGATAAGADVRIQVHFPHGKGQRKAASYGLTAGDDGSFSKSFNVGKVAGKGWVKVCASAGSDQLCTSKITFKVG